MTTRVTIVTGEDPVGLYAPDGSFNVVDATEANTPVGVYHPSGAYNVTFVVFELDEDDEEIKHRVAVNAPNGSINVIESDEPDEYNPCGAINVVVVDDQTD